MPENTALLAPLGPDDLAWRCPSDWLQFKTTAEIKSFEDVTEQREAAGALRLALRIRARGYNVYVAGAPGTGRSSMVRRMLEVEREKGPTPGDLLYVHNLQDPRAPRLLRLPPGKGRALREGMAAAAENYRQGLAALRASGAHRLRRERVARRLREQQAKLVGGFQEEVQKRGFTLVEINLGATRRHDVAPLVDGQPAGLPELPALVREGKLTAAQAEEMRRAHSELAAGLVATTTKMRELARELEAALAEADREAARPLVDGALDDVRDAVDMARGADPALDQYLDEARDFLLDVFPILFSSEETPDGPEDGVGDPLDALRVNVLVDRTGHAGRPVVEESSPTAARLLGSLEIQRAPDGSVRADIEGIRAGALAHADGGFLLINAHDLVAEEGAWTALRRALRTGKVAPVVGGPGEGPPPMTPAEIPVDVTVILVGSPLLRDTLVQGDEEFGKLFKVTSLLEDRVPLTRDAVSSYAAYVARLVEEERLLPFDAPAVGRIVEYLVRVAGMRCKISTRFRLMADLAREASWHAREAKTPLVDAACVERALAARRARQGLLSARILESIEDGSLFLQLEGAHVGQVNALAVVETSLERFGYPVRVTATTAVGRSGIIDIEREAELSGEIHTKASLILAGYLRSLFAQKNPLSVTASICFEQSYGGVEGDSASTAELASVLSSLADVPLRQDFALTGAVDQQGNVLAVGGVNEKVEGFWRVCRERGLTGGQGVLLPAASVPTLQLLPDVVEDVRAGRFQVRPVRNVDEVVTVLAGMPLGRPDAAGNWPQGTLGEVIAARMEEMAKALKEFGGAL